MIAWSSGVVPIVTVSETNMREPWQSRHRRRKKQRDAVRLIVPRFERWERVEVTLIRVAPRALDSDNLQGAMKAVRDGVSDRLGVDDGHPNIEWRYSQRRGNPKEYGVVIVVQSAQL